MVSLNTTLPEHLSVETQIGEEISITGKWVLRAAGGLFRASPDAEALRQEWADIHADADYRRHLARVLVERAVTEATGR